MQRPKPSPLTGDIEEHLLQALAHIRYGSVEITLHDGRIVQVESRNKTRFEPSRSGEYSAHSAE